MPTFDVLKLNNSFDDDSTLWLGLLNKVSKFQVVGVTLGLDSKHYFHHCENYMTLRLHILFDRKTFQ